MKPGMVKEIDSSGCCPKVKYICKHETCPKTPKCPRFYMVKYTQKEEDCCPKYSCGKEHLDAKNYAIDH